ncbi:hypothetical protein [Mycoplasma sp. Z663]|uniref:hypothetical protein n=1 Tax=Mycoplasma sp. Z663 TaxID=3401686 RepID=UPI003AAB24CA
MKTKKIILSTILSSTILIPLISSSCGINGASVATANNKISKINGINIQIPKNASALYDYESLNKVLDHIINSKDVSPSLIKTLNALIKDINVTTNSLNTLTDSDKIAAWVNVNTVNNFLRYYMLCNIENGLNSLVPQHASLIYNDLNSIKAHYKNNAYELSIAKISVSDLISKFKINPYLNFKNEEFKTIDNNKHEIDVVNQSISDIKSLNWNMQTLAKSQAKTVSNLFPAYELNWFNTLPLDLLFTKYKEKPQYKPYWTAENEYYSAKFVSHNIQTPAWYYNIKIKDNNLLTDFLKSSPNYLSPLTYNVSEKQNLNPIENLSYQEVQAAQLSKDANKAFASTLERYEIMKKHNPDLKLKYYKFDIPLNVTAKNSLPSIIVFPGREHQVFLNYEPNKYQDFAVDWLNNNNMDYADFKNKFQNVFKLQATRLLNQKSDAKYDQYLHDLSSNIDTIYKPNIDLKTNENPNKPTVFTFVIPVIDNGKALEVHVNTQNSLIYSSNLFSISKAYNDLKNQPDDKELYKKFTTHDDFSIHDIGVNKYFLSDFSNDKLLTAIGVDKTKQHTDTDNKTIVLDN